MADERPYQANATVSVRPKAAVKDMPPKVLPPLTEVQHARIKKTIAIVKEEMPEIVPMIKELHAMGMIDGWRSVHATKINNEGER